VNASSSRPRPALLYRIVHLENLNLLALRKGLHAPAYAPADGLVYHGIHDQSIRARRGSRPIPCGPGGTVDDYISFYLCPRSPMLYRLQADHSLRPLEGPGALVYLVCSIERIRELDLPFVFSDGHGLQAITRWYDDLERLDALDWKAIHTTDWRSTEDPDLTRRKQAEFLVHRFLPWDALLGIACYDAVVASDVERRLAEMPERTTAVRVRPDWYYDV
jgi:hypothetical protein